MEERCAVGVECVEMRSFKRSEGMECGERGSLTWLNSGTEFWPWAHSGTSIFQHITRCMEGMENYTENLEKKKSVLFLYIIIPKKFTLVNIFILKGMLQSYSFILPASHSKIIEFSSYFIATVVYFETAHTPIPFIIYSSQKSAIL
jgi:hypothetical protein